jgi:hypothetical protein
MNVVDSSAWIEYFTDGPNAAPPRPPQGRDGKGSSVQVGFPCLAYGASSGIFQTRQGR